MNRRIVPASLRLILVVICLSLFYGVRSTAQPSLPRYFAHPAVEDRHGVIAPWYKGLNGQCDLRARVAAETMKRYPWATNPKTGLPAPHYIYNGTWQITPAGDIAPRPPKDWSNGDLIQRCAYAMFGWMRYYRYTGDPAAIAHVSMMNDVILGHALTPADHLWPRFPVSVPTRGEMYGPANPHGMIQLDLVGFYGQALVQAYQLTGNKEWLEAARHWADLLAAKRSRDPNSPPWNRYANPEVVFWNDLQTGGVIMLLNFFDELIRVGYTGRNNDLVAARDAGLAYLKNTLLPRWLEDETWGRSYWDWDHPVQGEDFAAMVPHYLMNGQDRFPNWQADARNIMSLYLHRSCVSPKSDGDVYSGAWAYPEGSACCRRSLDYAPMQVGPAFAEFGVRLNNEWGREMARRQFILATYDFHETGVVEDSMDGGQEVAGGWFQCAHALPLMYVLDGIAWLPAQLGANRENHIVRSSAIVNHVLYDCGRIEFTTFDAPKNTVTVLRLAFRPARITANGRALKTRDSLDANGYALEELPNGDGIVSIRHDGRTKIVVEGNDPQQRLPGTMMRFSGHWIAGGTGVSPVRFDSNGRDARATTAATLHVTAETGAAMTCTFEGNQVRLIGSVGPDGGLADVYLDGVKQLCGIDFWNPYRREKQVVCHLNGLNHGPHTVRVVALGSGNPRSRGAKVALEAVHYSAATGDAGFGEGGGPTEPQRWIFGYPHREPYVDSAGHKWLPATEVVLRAGNKVDPVPHHWHTAPRRQHVAGTADPVLYRHGMQATNFTAYFTVGPGGYDVRVKLMESRLVEPNQRRMSILVNGIPVAPDLDIAVAAAAQAEPMELTDAEQQKAWQGLNRAVDLVFNGVQPRHGVIAVQFNGSGGGNAVVSSVEITPNSDARGRTTAGKTAKPALTPKAK